MKKLAIVVPFSYPSACGVWASVENLIPFLKKKFEVHVFSSNVIKGTNKISKNYETIDEIHYHRFPIRLNFSEHSSFWFFWKELIKLKPDIIHTHVYRHFHSFQALIVAKLLNVPCYLTTHAPFLDTKLRKFYADAIASFYDLVFGRLTLNKYKKVIAITKWEIPILLDMGCLKSRISFVPNGVDSGFFKVPIINDKIRKVVYAGRVSPVKNLEILNSLAIEFSNLEFIILGPLQQGYNFSVSSKNVKFINKKYNKNEEINFFKSSDIFILPSIREANPLVLMEAMGAGKIVICSNNKGCNELIDSGRGFIYKNYDDLKRILYYCIKNYKSLNRLRFNARKFSKSREWSKIAQSIVKIYLS
ncbi:glycosyltransferase family 4 protein [Candidatus Woesearchaeota archaeon]|nr:glycosyltransferase family 4 protein [Candidatus Woesearchaeota archaeon]